MSVRAGPFRLVDAAMEGRLLPGGPIVPIDPSLDTADVRVESRASVADGQLVSAAAGTQGQRALPGAVDATQEQAAISPRVGKERRSRSRCSSMERGPAATSR